MSNSIIPLILAGGTGTRLWPLSRDAMPKQFLPFSGARSTFQETLLRVRHQTFALPIVVTGPDFRFLAQHQAQEMGIAAHVVIEPMRRDSAAAVAAGALVASKQDPKSILLALAADHVVLDNEAFRAACDAAHEVAQDGYIVTFGLSPTAPKSAYGYILPGEPIGNQGVHKVKRFVEKPDRRAAEDYIRQGNYLWNSGNFLFRADAMLEEMERFQPDLVSSIQKAIAKASADPDLDLFQLDADEFAKAPKISIDYAVMERTARAAVIRGNFRWSDIGNWDSLADVLPADENLNIIHGDAEMIDSHGCIIHAGDKLVATIGVRDLVVVSTADAVMIAPRERSQDVRRLTQHLKEKNRPEVNVHPRVDRPWGHYESLDMGSRFQVKRIVVRQGGVLSLQKHHHRAEHWVVVSGIAEVTIGDEVREVRENESVYIPRGTIHRLANRGKILLELIEIQTGSYLGEDDIVRIEDIYKRT